MLDDPPVRDAMRSAVMMLLIPLAVVVIFFRLIELLTGTQLTWQDWARGGAMLLFLYTIVMLTRRRRFQ